MINSNLLHSLSCTVSKLWPIIGQIVAVDMGVPHFTAPAGVIPCEYPDKLYLSRNERDCPNWHWKLHDLIFMDAIPARDGRADGQNCSS